MATKAEHITAMKSANSELYKKVKDKYTKP